MKFFKKLLLVVAGVVAGIVVLAILAATNVFSFGPLVTTNSTDRGTQVIQAVEGKSEVALLSLGIQGIESRESNSEWFLGVIPGSERATFIQYSFHAKLGIDGAKVTITQTGENTFHIVIPEFIFIGYQDPTFELVTERNGLLSFVTPAIDQLEMANKILDDNAKQGHIDANRQILQDQAQAFYSGIVRGIDPTIELEFTFGKVVPRD